MSIQNQISNRIGMKMDLEMDPQFRAAINAAIVSAAEKGNVEAQLGLAYAFYNAKDPRRAQYWFHRAASEPHYNLTAMQELADLYELGDENDGSIQDIEKACRWMEAILEEMDDEQAKVPWMVKYGSYLIGGGNSQNKKLSKDKQDARKGVALLEKAVELRNDVPGEVIELLGNIFLTGKPPFEIDHTKAMKYYRMGAENGNERCAFKLALAYRIGVVPVDVEKGKYWQEKAIALGHSEASTLKELGKITLSETEAEEELKYLNDDERVDKKTTLDDQSKCYNPECINLEDIYGDRFMVCSKCRCVKYCSKECQVAHWKVHKKVCKTMLAWRNDILRTNRTMVQNRTKKS